MDWLDLLAVQGTLKSLLQHHSSKVLAIINSAAMNIGVHVSLSLLVSSVYAQQWDCWVIKQFYFQFFTGSEGLFSGLTASVHQSLLSLACRRGIRLSGAPRGLPHVAMVESPWAGTCPQNQLPEREAVGPYTVEILPWGVSVGPRGFQSQFCENGFFFPS